MAAQFAADVLLFRLMQGMTLRLSNLLHGKLTEKLCRAAYKPLSLRDDGELMTTITESAEGLGACFSVLASLAQLPVKVLVVFAAIFRIHWALFALCLVLFPLTLLPSLLLSKKLYALHLEEQRARGCRHSLPSGDDGLPHRPQVLLYGGPVRPQKPRAP